MVREKNLCDFVGKFSEIFREKLVRVFFSFFVGKIGVKLGTVGVKLGIIGVELGTSDVKLSAIGVNFGSIGMRLGTILPCYKEKHRINY